MTVLLLAACCVPHAAAAEAAVPSASFVVTQAGMNNAPALYAAFLADAIAEANAKMREPNYWCSVAAGQDGCSGCTCHERNTGVDVAAHMDRIRGARPPELGADITWRDGDFFALAGRPEDGSVQIEILDRDAAGAYVGAVRLTTMIGKIRMHFLDSFFLFFRRRKKEGGGIRAGIRNPFRRERNQRRRLLQHLLRRFHLVQGLQLRERLPLLPRLQRPADRRHRHHRAPGAPKP